MNPDANPHNPNPHPHSTLTLTLTLTLTSPNPHQGGTRGRRPAAAAAAAWARPPRAAGWRSRLTTLPAPYYAQQPQPHAPQSAQQGYVPQVHPTPTLPLT